MIKPICLVTGATGSVGPSIVQALCASGYQVRTLSLEDPPQEIWPSGVDVRLGDVTDKEAVEEAMEGVEFVIHLAAILHIVNPSLELREKYEKINVGGTAAVLNAAIKQGVKRVVLASSIAVYGLSHGEVLDEESTPSPDSFYGQTKLDAEKIVLSARREDEQPIGTVLRFAAIYGARIKGNYRKLVHALARGWIIPIGNGANRRTLIYEKDLARAAVLAMQHPLAAGRIYNVTDGQYHRVAEINEAIRAALGKKKMPQLAIPIFLLRPAIGAMEDLVGFFNLRSPISRATIDKYVEDIAVKGTRIQTELGFIPSYGIQSGWEETIQELKRAGNL